MDHKRSTPCLHPQLVQDSYIPAVPHVAAWHVMWRCVDCGIGDRARVTSHTEARQRIQAWRDTQLPPPTIAQQYNRDLWTAYLTYLQSFARPAGEEPPHE